MPSLRPPQPPPQRALESGKAGKAGLRLGWDFRRRKMNRDGWHRVRDDAPPAFQTHSTRRPLVPGSFPGKFPREFSERHPRPLFAVWRYARTIYAIWILLFFNMKSYWAAFRGGVLILNDTQICTRVVFSKRTKIIYANDELKVFRWIFFVLLKFYYVSKKLKYNMYQYLVLIWSYSDFPPGETWASF